MEQKKIKKIIKLLFDRPVNREELLIDRKETLEYLNKLAYFQPMGIYGICGETGVGKTTILNFIKADEAKKFNILISEKDSKDAIINDFLYRLADLALTTKSNKIKKIAREAKDFVITETTSTISYGGGANIGANISYEKSTNKSKRFNIYSLKEYIEKLLNSFVEKYEKVIITIDELDKENKEDVLKIVDSLKSVILKDRIITFISLPFSIYREYSNDRMRWNENGNLENIFKDMVFLEPLSGDEIQKMILTRLKDYPNYFNTNALKEIADFSEGNPRDALWLAQQVILHNTELNKINKMAVERVIKTAVSKVFFKNRNFTEIQKTVLKEILKNPTDRSSLIRKLEGRIKRQTVYTNVSRFINRGLIIEKDGILRLSTKTKYYIEDL